MADNLAETRVVSKRAVLVKAVSVPDKAVEATPEMETAIAARNNRYSRGCITCTPYLYQPMILIEYIKR